MVAAVSSDFIDFLGLADMQNQEKLDAGGKLAVRVEGKCLRGTA